MDPSLFYTGIVAQLYSPLRLVRQDPEPYARFIELSGEPALELGCGDGDPLLELRRRNIEIEGVDSSLDMLERCRRRAAEGSVDVVVHHQRMESLDLSRRYRSIFLAGPTFNLLPDDAVATQALGCIRAHLDHGGSALIPLFVPPATPENQIGLNREAVEADGSVIRCGPISELRDETSRRQETILRYERVRDDNTTVVHRPWVLHWYSQDSFRALASSVGLATLAVLDPEGNPAGESADAFAFLLQVAT